ncbi:MAG: hypothetical protein PHH47_02685 [Gallionella sp.]|nr:hypothetical protein [Gallionella sp.]MDD4945784.1 hypothetical protein [Gallionella sp.]MDD5611778.1 hypothetical protein [Gallionella sp.]
MKTQFLPLFTLSVSHQYYGAATCTDFDFVLAGHSRQALDGARLLVKVRDGRLHVLFEAGDDDQPVRDIAGMELLIGLRLRNPCFEYFTEAVPPALPLYINTLSSLDMPQTADLVERLFTPQATMNERPLTLELTRLGDAAPTRSDTVKSGESMPTLNLRDWQPGCYRVTQQTSAGVSSRMLVKAPDLARSGIWGAVNIRITKELWEAPTPPDFRISFQAREEKLHYYVVAPAGWSDFDKLSVTASSLAFEKIASDAFPPDGISKTQLGLPTTQAVLFRSLLPVQRSAAPALKIQLKRNGDTLVKTLPLPGAETPSARFVVQLSKP